MRYAVALLATTIAVAACAPKRIHEEPILESGDYVEDAGGAVRATRADTEWSRSLLEARRDSLAAEALAHCFGDVCDALARGELALGMTEIQVLAATRTTEDGWTVRRAGSSTIMVPRAREHAPRDVIGELALVQFRDGRVAAYGYNESQGVRVVSTPYDATLAGRAASTARALIREGDDLAARGDFAGALDRYDRADVLLPGDPELDYRIATVLDKQLRPIEALVRYRLFLHRLGLEKIEARGDAYAKLADAIAQARERIIVLEKQAR